MQATTTTIPFRHSIGYRLLRVLAIVLTLALTGSAIGWWSLQQIATESREMVEHSINTERRVSDWYRNVSNGVRRTSAIAVSSDPSLASFFAAETAEASKQNNELQKQIEEMLASDASRTLFAEVGAQRKLFLAARDAIVAAKKAGDAETASRLMREQFTPAANDYQAALKKLQDEARSEIDAAASRIAELNARAQMAQIMFAIASVLAGSALAIWLNRSIARPLRAAVAATERVARLDLTEDIPTQGKDETGRLLQSLAGMQTELRKMVGAVRQATDHIHLASGEIAAGNLDLSARTESTASNLQQTAASMEQLTSTVAQSADSARTANQLAASAAHIASDGEQMMNQVVQTMGAIDASSKKIADIISVIDGIAFQTNILALNAAVEAARAGEQGRGFAVVATEVRSLAGRSAEAAREIKALIGNSVSQVEAGASIVSEAGNTMHSIVGSVRRVSDIINEIAAATGEQSNGIAQVNSAVAQLDEMTQHNAALVEEGSAAAQSLKDQAEQLAQVVARFRLGHTVA